MGKFWNAWVEQIDEERRSQDATDRRRGFVRQLLTEFVVYATVGVLIVALGLAFDAFTPLVVFSNIRYEAPVAVVVIAGLLFETVWDSWLREVEEPPEGEEMDEGRQNPPPEQTTLEDDSEEFR